jgi:hypothetical protein
MRLIRDLYVHGGPYSFGHLDIAIINGYFIVEMARTEQGMKEITYLV